MASNSFTQNAQGVIDFRTANSEALGVKLAARIIYDSQKRMMLTKWGSQEDLPKNSGQTIQFVRYHNVDTGLNPIFGNTNPSSVKMSSTPPAAEIVRSPCSMRDMMALIGLISNTGMAFSACCGSR